ncbi:MAG: SGNH/GDSL hydrolase family protein [Spirochaetota bacterium]
MAVILCYGDSNTWGFNIEAYTGGGPMANARFAPGLRWPGIMAERLGPGNRVIEEGLNGRTTSQDDPFDGEHKNGLRYLLPCLESHMPLDLVILALGINDVKARFGASAADIANGAGRLIRCVLGSEAGPDGKAPKVLLVAPFPLGEGLSSSPFAELLGGKAEIDKSKLLGIRYEALARTLGVTFLDAGKVVSACAADSLHLDAEGQRMLGEAIAGKVLSAGLIKS